MRMIPILIEQIPIENEDIIENDQIPIENEDVIY